MASDPPFRLYWSAMENVLNSSGRGSGARRVAGNLLPALALILAITGGIRYRLLDIPLERDEGGFAYMAGLILDGVPPYVQAYDYKPPGLYVAYAAFIGIFGGGPQGIHLGLLVMSAFSAAMLYFLVRRWSNATGAAISALMLSVLLASPSVLGFAAHATHFVIFWSLLGCLLLERFLRSGRATVVLASGAAFGCATLMKHPGLLFLAYGLVVIIIAGREQGKTARGLLPAALLLLGGFLIPLALVAIWLGAAGALGKAVYWVVDYPALVAGGSDGTGLLQRFYRNGAQAAGHFLPVWLAAAAGFGYLLVKGLRPAHGPGGPDAPSPVGTEGAVTRTRFGAFCFFSLASVFIGYETRSHYFVLMLPALAAATGLTVSSILSRTRAGGTRLTVIAIPCLLAAFGIVKEREYFFSSPPDIISRTIYHPNPFADAGRIAAFIRRGTSDSDRIAILGSEPEILYLAGRRSATRYIFTNFFNERHSMKAEMEKEMAGEIDSAGPAMIVMINQPYSWGAALNGGWPILRWANAYLAREYDLAASVIPVSAFSSRFLIGEEALNDPGTSSSSVLIFRRKPPRSGDPPPEP